MVAILLALSPAIQDVFFYGWACLNAIVFNCGYILQEGSMSFYVKHYLVSKRSLVVLVITLVKVIWELSR
jgi:hypothetical protein